MSKKITYSKGEQKISRFLKKHKIEFVREKQFDTKVNKQLPFDFYLTDLNICIEYNGIQHYEVTQYSRNNLKRRQHNDNLRKEFCIKKNMELIVIPYWDFLNIKNILYDRLVLQKQPN